MLWIELWAAALREAMAERLGEMAATPHADAVYLEPDHRTETA